MRVFAILIALSLFSPNVSFASDGAEYLDFQDNVDGNKTLKDLPPEIFYNIAEYFGIKDIAHMLLVSKNLHEVFIPILFRYLQNNELKLDLSNGIDYHILDDINMISQGRVPYLKIKTALKNYDDVFNLQFYGPYIAELCLTKISTEFLNTILESDLSYNLRLLNLSGLDGKSMFTGIENLHKLVNLKSLDLSFTRMILSHLNKLLELLPNNLLLTSLNLSGNNLQTIDIEEADIFAKHLLKLPNLEVLKLYGCLFKSSDELLPAHQIMIMAIANLHELKILDMGLNNDTLSAVLKIEDIIFSSLQFLDIRSNFYNDNNIIKVIEMSSKFPNLKSLFLSTVDLKLNEGSKEALKGAYPNVEIRY